MGYKFKKGIILLASPFILVTGCNKVDKVQYSSLTTSEQEYFNNSLNYENKDELELIQMICKNHSLYQVNEILHYNIDNNNMDYVKEVYNASINSYFYNSVKKSINDYDDYKKIFEIRYDEETNNMFKELVKLYNKYIDVYTKGDSYNVIIAYSNIINYLNKIDNNKIINNVLGYDFNINNVTINDNSLLDNLINDNNSISIKVKYLFDIYYKTYEIDNNNLHEINGSTIYNIHSKDINTNEIKEPYTYKMDSDGILWKN